MDERVAMEFHHVGVAVHDIDEALKTYCGLFGFRRYSDPVDVPSQGVRVCFVESAGGFLVELIEGLGEKSKVTAILDRSGPGPYHICYKVEDLDHAVKLLRKQKCRPFRRFEQPGNEVTRFAFLLSPDQQIFELCAEPLEVQS